jgi:hypothetical protein
MIKSNNLEKSSNFSSQIWQRLYLRLLIIQTRLNVTLVNRLYLNQVFLRLKMVPSNQLSKRNEKLLKQRILSVTQRVMVNKKWSTVLQFNKFSSMNNRFKRMKLK